jgi:hypothetical protein
VQRYGGDLFHAKFMTLANLRGILHRGVGPYLDSLAEEPDPLHPIRLLDDLDRTIPREKAIRYLQSILQAVVDNYEVYRDYNTTTTHSDYGENLHMLLEFLQLKASYERNAWQFRPMALVHTVLARRGQAEAAVRWQEAITYVTQELAAQLLDELAKLEQQHGMRLRTVADRLEERFVKPLALDRLCALIEPAMTQARQGKGGVFLARLREGLQPYLANPTGVGLDVPEWLHQLELEVQRVRAAQTAIGGLAEEFARVPVTTMSLRDLQRQFHHWDQAPWEE